MFNLKVFVGEFCSRFTSLFIQNYSVVTFGLQCWLGKLLLTLYNIIFDPREHSDTMV